MSSGKTVIFNRRIHVRIPSNVWVTLMIILMNRNTGPRNVYLFLCYKKSKCATKTLVSCMHTRTKTWNIPLSAELVRYVPHSALEPQVKRLFV